MPENENVRKRGDKRAHDVDAKNLPSGLDPDGDFDGDDGETQYLDEEGKTVGGEDAD